MYLAVSSLNPVADTPPLQVLGPVIGGFVASRLGWRWTFWLLCILGAALGLAAGLLMRETNPKTLLERKTARLRAATANPKLQSKLSQPHFTPSQVLAQALIRPTMLLFRSPVLLIMSLYVALVFGLMYLLFTTFTDVFEGYYGFSAAISGLTYLGLGIALILAMVVFRTLGNKVLAARMKADGVDRPRPEHRLVLMIWFSPFVGLGLFVYGWTAHYQVHWIVPLIGTALIGFGAFFVLVSPALPSPSPIAPRTADTMRAAPTRCPRSFIWWICSDPMQLLRPWGLITCCDSCLARFFPWQARRCTGLWATGGETHCSGSLHSFLSLPPSSSTDLESDCVQWLLFSRSGYLPEIAMVWIFRPTRGIKQDGQTRRGYRLWV